MPSGPQKHFEQSAKILLPQDQSHMVNNGGVIQKLQQTFGGHAGDISSKRSNDHTASEAKKGGMRQTNNTGKPKSN